MTPAPEVSVVIPTRNRCPSLIRLLVSLEKQTALPDRFEVIVAGDDCTDGTAAFVRRYAPAFSVRYCELGARSAAAARNRGSRLRRAPLLLFLDDDLAASPALVEAHLAAHGREAGEAAVIGPYYPAEPAPRGLFRATVRNWWEDQFRSMGSEGHRFTWRDLLAGNLSMPAGLFDRIGGFDFSFPGAGTEDWELGIRLVSLGVPIRFAPEAAADHFEHETMSLHRSLVRATTEGAGLARIESLHPEFPLEGLREAALCRRGARRMVRLTARAVSRTGALPFSAASPLLALLDRSRFRRLWRHAYGAVRLFRFWRGYYRERGGAAADADRVAAAGRNREAKAVAVDLADGRERSAAAMDRAGASTAHFFYRGRYVGRIAPEWGAEPLGGRHLAEALRGAAGLNLAKELLKSESFSRHTRS